MSQPFLPNEADAFHANQAEPDSVDFNILLAGYQRTGVVSGCAITEDPVTPDMTVDVAAGVVSLAGSQIVVSVQLGNVITAADVTNPRFDLITVNSSGTVVVTAGTPAAQPVLPDIPATSVPLAAVYVPANDTAITNPQIVDKRVALGSVIVDDVRYVSTGGSDTYDGLTRDTAFLTPAAAVADLAGVTHGAVIYIAPGEYAVGAGITSTIPGLVVIGEGHRGVTPGTPGTIGVTLSSTTAAAWVWTVDNPDKATANEYEGSRFESIQFKGNATTAGGLLSHVNNLSLVNCAAYSHTTGVGFKALPDGAGSDDTSWTFLGSCIAQNCLSGFDIDGGFQAVAPITLKTSAGAIQNTGSGLIARAQGTVIGGKFENDGTGLEIPASTDVTVIGTRVESCPTAVTLNKGADATLSRHKFIGLVINGSTTPFNVGANNEDDIIIGCNAAGTSVDNGVNTQWIASTVDAHTIYKGTSGQSPIRFFETGTEVARLRLGATGLSIDARPLVNGSLFYLLGSANASSSHRFQDSAQADLFRVRGSGLIEIPVGPVRLGASSVDIRTGTGTPEGVVTANVGSVYLRNNGGLGTSFYYKASGTGNTGWRSVGIGSVEYASAPTLGWGDGVVNIESTAATRIVTLPDNAAFAGKQYLIRRDGTNVVTINRAGTDTFDDADIQKTLDTDGAAIGIFSIGDGEWKIVATQGTVGGS